MIYIESLAKELYPELSGRTFSTTCLCTSNPVYLIFTDNHTHPEIVIRLSDSDSISQAHKTLVELYKFLGDLVPEPLMQTRHGPQYVSVQKGLRGTPWFQLAGNIITIEQWENLKTEAISTLDRMHQGIQSSDNWTRICSPGEELRQCYQNCLDSEVSLPAETESLVSILSDQLDELGNITAFPQHGDFCLNNLIIEDNKMHIIDFEDFGLTYMPLYDQFTLALSTYQLAPDIAHTSLTENIDQCISSSLDRLQIDRQYASGLFMYHLLLRLGEWSKNRLPYREWLLTILEMFILDRNLVTN